MGPRPYRGENPAPLIRPSVRTGVPSPKEEGVGSAQIGRNLPYCGTFRYIYWELWRSAPVGGGRPSVPPLRQKRGKPGRRAESSRPTKGVAGTCPLIRPIRGHLSLSPLSLRDNIPTPFGLRPFPPDRGNRPLDKGSWPPGEGLGGPPSVPPLRVKRNIPWRAADSRPYADTGRGPFSSQGPVPDQPAQDSHRERWFGKPRRRNKIAPVPIFSHSGPQWGRTERHPSTPNFARRKGRTTSKG